MATRPPGHRPYPDSGPAVVSAVDEFTTSRPRLFGIAYRMLGSVAEAEDVVQEAWVRWQRTDRSRGPQPRQASSRP